MEDLKNRNMPEKLQTQNVLIDMPPTPATHPTERRQKIAAGHKSGDHEDERTWQQTM